MLESCLSGVCGSRRVDGDRGFGLRQHEVAGIAPSESVVVDCRNGGLGFGQVPICYVANCDGRSCAIQQRFRQLGRRIGCASSGDRLIEQVPSNLRHSEIERGVAGGSQDCMPTAWIANRW